ncbi:MAG: hypothetical protein KatS3mg008_2119 [Acidimicrobiales bacterium]|nr:MAG: hypothetical protein KatS3mg008_2119 [Acidimicrobiales bacterium]
MAEDDIVTRGQGSSARTSGSSGGTGSGGAVARSSSGQDGDDGERSSDTMWIGIAVAVLAVAGIIAIIIGLTGGSDSETATTDTTASEVGGPTTTAGGATTTTTKRACPQWPNDMLAALPDERKLPEDKSGYFLWWTFLGWHLRVKDPEGGVFTGFVDAGARLPNPTVIPKGSSAVQVRLQEDGTRLVWQIKGGDEFVGFDVAPRCQVQLMSWNFAGENAPWPREQIYLGRDNHNPQQLPLVVRRVRGSFPTTSTRPGAGSAQAGGGEAGGAGGDAPASQGGSPAQDQGTPTTVATEG